MPHEIKSPSIAESDKARVAVWFMVHVEAGQGFRPFMRLKSRHLFIDKKC